MLRWQEEVELLEEFQQVIQGLKRMEKVYTSLAESIGDGPGHVAFALKTANIYHHMAADAEFKFCSAEGTWPADGVLLQDHVQCLCQSLEIDWASFTDEE